ncbi:hypothetical protein [Thioalkalivibrio sp. ALE11]|uniref:hypothetical protein n=1 Tax=Thioalkalivibrio sp. ALE11 TaxID=1265494 RepID=UPI0012DF84F3|nr:hypothetical protein [Thioalkalivibrio sp. ALE11]
MGYEMPERPRFLENALQGLAFWIGHRHSLFRSYPLPEGAMVAEACNLIQANLSDSLELRPECQYKRLVQPDAQLNGIGDLARADLVVFSRNIGNEPNGDPDRVQFVMEVKRGSAANANINDDLKRLYTFLSGTQTNARAFLIVVSESKAPARFVAGGKSRLGSHPIPDSLGCFHVRRTVKAAASFSNKNSAHYVCLIEVFRDRPTPLPKI